MKQLFWQGILTSKRMIMWLVYAVFALYLLYVISQTPATGAKFFFIITGILVLGVAFLFEYLKRLYEKMIYALTINCDTNEAQNWREQLVAKDFFKGFRQSIVLFDVLLYLDTGAYEDCLAHLKKHETFFRGTVDYLFIYYYSQLICYYFLEETTLFTQCFEHLQKIKTQSQKKPSRLFAWSEIEGLALLQQARYQKSLKIFETTDLSRFNSRELAYHYYWQAQAAFALRKTKLGSEKLKEARVVGNTLAIVERKRGRSITNEKFATNH